MEREQKAIHKSQQTIKTTFRNILHVAKERIANVPELEDRYTPWEIEEIINLYTRKMIEHCVLTQRGIQMPHGIGIIIIGKFKPREGTHSEMRAKVSSYQRNLHDPYICKWVWKNDRYTYWGNKIPSRFFKFRPKPAAKQGLRYGILNGVSSSRFFHLQSRAM